MLHGIMFPGGQFLSQLSDAVPSPNVVDLIGRATGHPDPLFIANREEKVDQKFTTTQIKTMLDLCGATFFADLSAGNTDLQYKAGANLGVRQAAASTVHQRLRMTTGAVYWDGLSVEHQQDAVMNGRIVPIFDGTHSPLIPAGGVALTGTPTAGEFFTLGPVEINGSELAGVKSWKLDLGNVIIEESATGDIYITYCGLGERQPSLEVMSLEAGAWNTFGLDGLALSSLVFFLRRKAADGNNVANATATHTSFTATSGKVNLINSSGGGNTPVVTGIRIPLRASSSSAAILAINTATAIT